MPQSYKKDAKGLVSKGCFLMNCLKLRMNSKGAERNLVENLLVSWFCHNFAGKKH